jgi:hypothetical protein
MIVMACEGLLKSISTSWLLIGVPGVLTGAFMIIVGIIVLVGVDRERPGVIFVAMIMIVSCRLFVLTKLCTGTRRLCGRDRFHNFDRHSLLFNFYSNHPSLSKYFRSRTPSENGETIDIIGVSNGGGSASQTNHVK